MTVPKPYVGPAPTLDTVPAPTDWGQLVRHVGPISVAEPVSVEGTVGGVPVIVTGTVSVTEPVGVEGTVGGVPVDVTGTVSSPSLATRFDEPSSTLMYVGTAVIGSADGAAVWAIKEITTVGTVLSVKWANGGASNQIWANRAILVYT
jgi:hypothetical protein